MTESKKLTGKEAQEFFDAAKGKEKIADETRKKIGKDFFDAVMSEKPENPAQQPTSEPKNPFALPDSIKPKRAESKKSTTGGYKKDRPVNLGASLSSGHGGGTPPINPASGPSHTPHAPEPEQTSRRQFILGTLAALTALGLSHEIANHQREVGWFDNTIETGLKFIDYDKLATFSEEEDALQAELKRQGALKDSNVKNYLFPESHKLSEALDEGLVELDIKNTLGENIKLKKTVAKAFERAYEAAKKDGITMIVTSSFRTNQDQARVRKDPNSKKPAAIGNSPHEAGHAVDVDNYHEAEPYLKAEGFWGGYEGIDEDFVHFEYQWRNRPKVDKLEALKRKAFDTKKGWISKFLK